MHIDHYSFGKIEINGGTYTKDVIIFPDRVFSPWWRKDGHSLAPDDLQEIIGARITELIIGTGYYGTMRVPEGTLKYLESKGIKCSVKNTQDAVSLYNKKSNSRSACAALHLTC